MPFFTFHSARRNATNRLINIANTVIFFHLQDTPCSKGLIFFHLVIPYKKADLIHWFENTKANTYSKREKKCIQKRNSFKILVLYPFYRCRNIIEHGNFLFRVGIVVECACQKVMEINFEHVIIHTRFSNLNLPY